MIKLKNILSELKARSSGYKFVEGDYKPRTKEEIKEIESLAILEVTGELSLSGTKITRLPDNLKVGGDLWLNATKITRLPDNLKVGGGLYLYGTTITKLPNNLKVGGDLSLYGTLITKLPNNLKVGGILRLFRTPLAEKYTTRQIRRMIVRQGGSIGGRVYRR